MEEPVIELSSFLPNLCRSLSSILLRRNSENKTVGLLRNSHGGNFLYRDSAGVRILAEKFSVGMLTSPNERLLCIEPCFIHQRLQCTRQNICEAQVGPQTTSSITESSTAYSLTCVHVQCPLDTEFPL